MQVLKLIKRIVITLFVVTIVIALLTPLALYQIGLHGAGSIPTKPSSIASQSDLQKEWRSYRGQDEPSLTKMNPYTYLFVANEPGPTKVAALAAWRVARSQLLETQKYRGKFWWHLSGAALSIWLTRNWSIEELLSKSIELNKAATAGGERQIPITVVAVATASTKHLKQL